MSPHKEKLPVNGDAVTSGGMSLLINNYARIFSYYEYTTYFKLALSVIFKQLIDLMPPVVWSMCFSLFAVDVCDNRASSASTFLSPHSAAFI